MSGDAELLNFIYQNSQMGVDTIRQLIGVVEDKDLKEHLKTQFQGYEEFHQAAKELLNEHGYDEKGLGIVEKARTYFMINLQTMTDPSASHIASMLITGSSMGIVEAIQKYRQYEDADPKIRDLMDKLRKFEEHNMEKLKDFLWKSYSVKLPASADPASGSFFRMQRNRETIRYRHKTVPHRILSCFDRFTNFTYI